MDRPLVLQCRQCEGVPHWISHRIAWQTPTTPLPIENDPRAVFERLFGVADSTEPAARQAHLRRNRSMLDAVSEQIARLRTRIGPGDTLKLNQYLDSLRDVERRIEKAEEQAGRELPVIEQPMGVPGNYADHAV